MANTNVQRRTKISAANKNNKRKKQQETSRRELDLSKYSWDGYARWLKRVRQQQTTEGD